MDEAAKAVKTEEDWYEELRRQYVACGAAEEKLALCDSLLWECARAARQLAELNGIAAQSGLVLIHPADPRRQKALPIGAELSRLRASLANMSYKLTRLLVGEVDVDDGGLDEFL